MLQKQARREAGLVTETVSYQMAQRLAGAIG
jgi:hypothetical protein